MLLSRQVIGLVALIDSLSTPEQVEALTKFLRTLPDMDTHGQLEQARDRASVRVNSQQ